MEHQARKAGKSREGRRPVAQVVRSDSTFREGGVTLEEVEELRAEVEALRRKKSTDERREELEILERRYLKTLFKYYQQSLQDKKRPD